ncbi:MAG: hypothetical protein PHS04_18555 [Tissierellia bacterium]|nr:hypothetical protein [Tissierellia bacterium]
MSEGTICPVCGKLHKYIMCKPIENKITKMLLNKLRDMWCECGGKLWESPEEHGVYENQKIDSGIEVDFDYGAPHRMYTPDGSYMVLGSCMCGNTKEFMRKLEETFNVEIVVPKRDDSKCSYIEYQCEISGPVIRISEKQDVFKWEK